MKAEYGITATIHDDVAQELLTEFEDTFAKHGVAARRLEQAVCVDLNYYEHREIAELAVEWGKKRRGIHVRESCNHLEFTEEECRQSQLCQLRFARCYVWPRPNWFKTCSFCGSDTYGPTGEIPNDVDLRCGIGEYDGCLFLSEHSADILKNSGLTGFTIEPWEFDPYFCVLIPASKLDVQLLEGKNVIGSTGKACSQCGKSEFRFFVGPYVLRKSDYAGDDIVGLRLFQTSDEIAFSQRAADFFKNNFRKVSFHEPIVLQD